MKERKHKSREPILAAGGIVLRSGRRPQFAVVKLRKLGTWGLPKGKLAAGEDAMTAARREVLEETGHRVTIHEFLGTVAYEASGRPKVIQFWRMHAIGEPIGDLMRDVKAVEWLVLEDAIDRLTHLRERVFLEQVGPIALKLAERSAERAAFRSQPAAENLLRRALLAPRLRTIGKVAPLAPAADGNAPFPDPPPDAGESRETAEPIEPDPIVPQDFAEPPPCPASLGGNGKTEAAPDVLTPAQPSWQSEQETEIGAGRGLIEKTWVWLRHATTLHRQPLD
jgi:8-oxo-dGTP diphosphatase